MFTTRRFRQIALTTLLFVVILSLLLLLLIPHGGHGSGYLFLWLCFAPFLLFAPADFRRTLPITGSTFDRRLSLVLALPSRFQLPPPTRNA